MKDITIGDLCYFKCDYDSIGNAEFFTEINQYQIFMLIEKIELHSSENSFNSKVIPRFYHDYAITILVNGSIESVICNQDDLQKFS